VSVLTRSCGHCGHGVNRSLGLLLFREGARRAKSGIAESIKLPLFARAFDKKYQEKVAFTDGNGNNFTFRELGQKSLTLSKELKTRVQGNEERIAFLCDRNFSFPTTMVATWMANHIGELTFDPQAVQRDMDGKRGWVVFLIVCLFILQLFLYRLVIRRACWNIS